jgi:hypothetical protein
MLSLLAASIVAVAAQSPLLSQVYGALDSGARAQVYDLTNGYSGLVASNYGVSWTTVAGMDCDSRYTAAFLKDTPSSNSLLCSTQGLGVPTLDGPDSPALCGTLDALKLLCKSLDDCHSVTFHEDLGNRGYLNTMGCAANGATIAETSTNMYVKVLGATPTCVLGEGAELAGGKYPSVMGTYIKVTSDLYEHMDGLSKIEKTDPCTFKVYRSTYVAPTPAAPSPTCADKDDVVSALFGMENTAGICAVASNWVGAASYCNHPIFASLCSVTCGTDCFTDDAALCSSADCDDVALAAACPVKCPAPTLRQLQEMEPTQAHMIFRAAMKDATLDAKYGVRRSYAVHQAKARRLAWTDDLLFEEVFSTKDPTAAQSGAPCDLGVYAGLWDIVAFHKALPITIDSECPGSELKWDILDGVYCSNKNMPSIYTSIPEISAAACYNKCAMPVGGHGNESDAMVDGKSDWCSGYSVDFTQDTDALCIPREECEALCILAGDLCSSIDMHRFLPRCYLNAKDACGPFNATTGAPTLHELTKSPYYDVIYPTVTLEEETAAYDGARDVYVTYTGKALPAGCLGSYETSSFVASSPISLDASLGDGRAQCEGACSGDSTCVGFQFETLDAATPDESCTLARTGVYLAGTTTLGDIMSPCEIPADAPYVASPPGSRLSHIQTVMKENPGSCYIDVTAAVEVEEMANITIPGTYFKKLAGSVYLKTDNTTRMKYNPGGSGSDMCDGWTLEKNLKPLTEVIIKNCTDNPPLAAYFLKVFHAEGLLMKRKYVNSQGLLEPLDADGAPASVIGGAEYPCQWGFDEGWCNDKVFWALCAHTCTRFETVYINDVGYRYQFEGSDPMLLYRNATYDFGITHSTCDGDNNVAAYSWLMDYSFGDPMKRTTTFGPVREDFACLDIASSNKTHDATKWTFCDEVDTLGFLKYFCKIQCPLFPTFPPNPNSTYVDEVHAIGSQYNSPYVYFRRLEDHKEEETWFEDRKLQVSGYTTASAGKQASITTVTYLDGSDSNDFVELLKTYAPGAHKEHQPYGGADLVGLTVVNGTGCQVGAPTGSQMALDLLEGAMLYNIEVPFDPTASLDYVCRGVDVCPEFTTCILSPLRFEDEFSLAFSKGWVGSKPNLDGVNTKAKVIVTDYRGTAIISALKADLNNMVFRSAMGSTRATLKSVASTSAAAVESVVMSLVSPTAAMGYYAETEYSTTFGEITGSLGYLSDVLRVEAFQPAGSYVPVMTTIDMYIGAVAKAEDLRVVMIPYGLGPVLVDAVTYDPATMLVTISAAFAGAADFFITSTVDACMVANPCDAKATCTNMASGVYSLLTATCTCNDMYTGDGITCALKPEFYDHQDEASTLDFYVKISHMDVMDFGWRVKEIELYSDFECTSKIPFSSVKLPFPGEPGTSTYDKITSASDVYTGEFGYSHYPAPTDLIGTGGKGSSLFKYGNQNLMDGSETTEWWSECLNCNPMTPTTIEFMLKGDTILGCIKVVQDANHASKTIKFEKGFTSGPDCGMMPGKKRCEPVSVWTETMKPVAKDAETATVEVKTTCGTANQQIFGEIMLVAGTNWEGSYANNHPVESACHCHMLCIAHLDQGCRSFKFYEETDGKEFFRHCYLQSNIFTSGNGFYGTSSSKNAAIATGWTSGTPALRYVKNSKLMDMPYLFSMSTDPPLADALDAGSTFTITVSGAGMPYSEAKSLDASDLQRVKLVYATDGCEAMVPKEVTGISCIESVKSVPLLAGPVDTKIYTFCGPRPTTASPDAITFEGIKITQAAETTEYKVCYCAFDCFEPARWQVVPETLTVPGSVFSWETMPGTILRKTETNEFDVTVTRPAFGSHSLASGWELKIIRDFYDCDVDMDPAIFAASAPACSGPDVCTWTYTITAGLSEVGKYLACFRQTSSDDFTAIPSGSGEKFIVVEKLAADYVHPRGIFHNQLFSALAGGQAIAVELAGTRMAVPTMGAITLTSGTCADPSTYSFAGGVPPKPSTDMTPPTLLGASSGTIGTTDASLLLEFSEPVMRGKKCMSSSPPSIILRSSGSPIEIPCSSPYLVLQRNKVMIIPSSALAAATYFFEIETGVFEDEAGHEVMLTLTNALFEFTIATAAETAVPEVVLSFPADGDNDYNATEGIALYFTEEVNPAPGAGGNFSLGIVKCGAICTPMDPVLYTPALTLMSGAGTAALKITEAEGNFKLEDMARYKITLPKDSLQDGAGNTGPSADFVFEFVKGEETYFYSKVFRALATSTAEKLDFSVALDEDTPAGTYSVCYCSGQSDGNLALLGDFGYNYELTEDRDCSATPVLDLNTTDALIMGLTLEDHVCSVKCDKGCIGPHCYCDGYTADATSDTLCLPKTLCAEACSAVAEESADGLKSGGCKGMVVHDSLPTCVLLADVCTDATAEEIFQYFERKDGTACTNFGDFSETAGAAVVTSRVHVDVDYIFKPATNGSVEVTATATASLLGAGLTQTTAVRDRITIIDCGGTCGISSPTKSLAFPLMGDSIAMWNEFVPYTVYEDPPHIDAENPKTAKSSPPMKAAPLPAELYTTFPDESDPAVGYYVMGHNIDVTSPKIAFDGDMRSLEEFQCFKKCSDGCSGDSCYCDGYFAGYDTETSTALCADQTLCQYLCDQLGRDGCMSVDMHATLPRCFLNDASADTTPVALTMDPSYKVLVKREFMDNNFEYPTTVTQASGGAESAILPVVDYGYSFDKMLRFKDIQFKSGGTFKLCFCDSSLITGPCKTEADYSVQVGTIHSSGVQCLISKPELQRASCVPTYFGKGSSLRCYKSPMEAPAPLPPTIGELTALAGLSGTPSELADAGVTTACAFGAEEAGCPTVPEAMNAAPARKA